MAIKLGIRTQRRTAGRTLAIDSSEVAQVAYELYEQRGRTDGHDLEDWLRAEEILRGRQAAQNGGWS